jgi:hypothetical protein
MGSISAALGRTSDDSIATTSSPVFRVGGCPGMYKRQILEWKSGESYKSYNPATKLAEGWLDSPLLVQVASIKAVLSL